MTVELFHIADLGDRKYSLGLRGAGEPLFYTITLSEEPVLGISGPHSLWSNLSRNKEALNQILSAITEMLQTGTTTLPKQLQIAEKDFKDWSANIPFWASQSSAWYLSNESLEWSLKHLLTRSSNSLFPLPFEHYAMRDRSDEFVKRLGRMNLCNHSVRDFRQLWVPKSSAGRRAGTQLDPLDAAILSAIAYEFGEAIERGRIPSTDGIVYSFLFLPEIDGRIWDSRVNYDLFRDRTIELLLDENIRFVAETDIAAFYHQTKVGLVCSQLERVGIKRKHAAGLGSILSSMAIEGLPVGPSISALLAELILIPIDLHMLALGARFIRFNDDYRFFCRTEVEAQRNLQDLAEALSHTAGLTLQNLKTRIWDRDTYFEKVASTWLTELYPENEMEEDSDERRLVESARRVLEKSLDLNHVAWVKLFRDAFKALPLEDKKAVLPLILEQLARVWGVAPQLSRSLEALLQTSDGGQELLELVSARLADQSMNLQDYAASWVLHAFWKKEWKGKESLADLDLTLKPAHFIAARRELLIALRDTHAAASVYYDTENPWHHRARVWATRTTQGTPVSEDLNNRLEWLNALYQAIITTEPDKATNS